MQNNRGGFSLVEVLIAIGISTAGFLYLNKAMVDMKKAQIRFERRSNITNIKRKLTQALTNFKAWEEHPGREVPNQSNEESFFYYPRKRGNLVPLGFPLSEIKEFYPDASCLKEKGCRIILVSYQGLIYTEEDLGKRGGNHLRAIVEILTPEEEISRSYLPKLKVTIVDTNDKAEYRLRPQQLYLNTINENKVFESKGSEVNPIARSKCFTDVLKTFPGEEITASSLCSKATTTAPALCYKILRKDKGKSALVSQVVCNSASNLEPINCFEKALETSGIDKVNAAILCSGARSMEPLNCHSVIREFDGSLAEKEETFKICARAEDSSPGECLVNLYKANQKYLTTALTLCPHHKG